MHETQQDQATYGPSAGMPKSPRPSAGSRAFQAQDTLRALIDELAERLSPILTSELAEISDRTDVPRPTETVLHQLAEATEDQANRIRRIIDRIDL